MYEPRPLRLRDGVEIAYADRGSGEPVLFVPGWTMSCEVFAHQLEGLGSGFRVIAFDPRSHGRSSRTLHGNSYPQQGRDLGEIIETLGLSDVHLVGWSYGVLAAYAYLDQFGDERVRSVTAIDMTPTPLATNGDGLWDMGDVDEFLEVGVAPALADPVGFAHGFADRMTARALSDGDREWLVGMHLATDRHAAISLEISAMHSDYGDLAARLSARIPFANAVGEKWVDDARRWLAAHAPKAVLWAIPSHLWFWESPAEFNERLRRFLRDAR